MRFQKNVKILHPPLRIARIVISLAGPIHQSLVAEGSSILKDITLVRMFGDNSMRKAAALCPISVKDALFPFPLHLRLAKRLKWGNVLKITAVNSAIGDYGLFMAIPWSFHGQLTQTAARKPLV
jgi:hypothetical protein